MVEYTPGGIWARFLAVMVDGLLMVTVTMPTTVGVRVLLTGEFHLMDADPLAAFRGARLLATVLAYALNVLEAYLYASFFYRAKGATPGKMLLGLEVVDLRTGGHPGFGRTFLRETVGKLASTLLLIGYLLAFFRADRRALHDLIAGTRVIRRRVPAG